MLQRENREVKAYEKMRKFYTMEGAREGTLNLAAWSNTCGSQNSEVLCVQGRTNNSALPTALKIQGVKMLS